MSPATASLIALLLAILVSLTSRVNVGVLAIALAWAVGVLVAGWQASVLMAAFPAGLFLTLVGVTLLFAASQANGTLARLTGRAVRLCHGNAALLPLLFFALACLVSTLGPGAVASTALVAPLALSVGAGAGVPAFLSALMVGNGANAGNLSPISAVGLIVQTGMNQAGLPGHDWLVWAVNAVAHALAGLAAFLLFGGPRLFRARAASAPAGSLPALEGAHWLTLAVTGAWIGGVVLLDAHPGLAAFAAVSLLIVAGAADEAEVVRRAPWAAILMVTGVSVLVGVLEKTGGMELFTSLLARVATPRTVNGTIAFATGLISTYSSTSGVVYPAFLPTVPGLVQKLGGGDPLQVALSINVGAAIVDVSPLSTIGALCVAAAPPGEDTRVLFRKLLLWGFSMTLVGALFCQLLIPLFV